MTYQLTAPLLDACVLGIVEKEDAYGYTLTQKVRELVDISESTLYPVLRRLQKDECLVTYDAPYQGRNRRYYAITDYGRRRLEFYKDEWEKYKANIDRLLLEEQIPTENQSGDEVKAEVKEADGKEEQGNE
jgi:transcriptional regulator, PadR family